MGMGRDMSSIRSVLVVSTGGVCPQFKSRRLLVVIALNLGDGLKGGPDISLALTLHSGGAGL